MENNIIEIVLNFLNDKEGKEFPLKWKIVNNQPLTKKELNVKGNLKLGNSNIKSLPKGLKVGGDLWADNCTSLTSIPAGLKVVGNIFLANCTSLKSLPKGLKVASSLNLEKCTSLTSLPEGFEVGGDLWLNNCTSLELLPKGLKVGGDLLIKDTPLSKLSYEDLFNMIANEGYIIGRIYRK